MPDVPKNAKKPQDHVSKDEAAAVKAEATTGLVSITFNDVEYTVDQKRVSTVGFMDLLDRVNEGEGYLLPRVVKKMLGDDQWTEFLTANHDDEVDDVPLDVIADFFTEADAKLGNS